LIFWKIKLPKRQTKILLLIYFGVLIVGILILIDILWFFPEYKTFVLKSFLEYLHICFFYTSLTLAYMITYSAIEVDSPSLVMILKISEAGGTGIHKEKFDETMINDDLFIKPRINDLINDRTIYLEGNKYKLKPKGFLMAWFFTFYRKMLNTGKGG
jgi:hypothetical protein